MTDDATMIRPGDWLLIAVQMPKELDDSESCHPDLMLSDFLSSMSAWNVEVRGVVRREQAQTEKRSSRVIARGAD